MMAGLTVLGLRGVAALEAPLVEVRVVGVGDSLHVQLNWDPVPGATSYRVLGRADWLDAAAQVALVDSSGVDLVWPGPVGLFTERAESALPEMVQVPAGTFVMGSGAYGDLFHQATLTHDYWLARTETTNAEFLDALNWAWGQGGLAIGYDISTDMDWVLLGSMPLLPVARAATHDDLVIIYDAEAGHFILHAGTLNTNIRGPGFAYPDGYDPAQHPVKYVTWMGAAA
jgi:formylglycine-generating enzyme required for sulfatase activity